MAQTGTKIPISDAKEIATKRGYSQVIIHAYDRNTGIQHVTTWGKNKEDCANAAEGGNAIKKLLKWENTNAKPSAVIKLEKQNADFIEVAKMLVNLKNNPNRDDVINLAKFVGIGVIAENFLKEHKVK